MPFTPYGRLGNGAAILAGAPGPAGPTGPTGPAGPAGNYVNRYQGAWAAGTAYAVGDIVTYSGSSWLATAASTGVTPVAGPTWAVVAQAGTGQVNTVNGKAPTSGNVALTAADVSAVPSTSLGAANGVATLGSDGVIPTSQIPALALTNAVTVASQAAMLALTSSQVQPGDLAIRTDGAGTFILTATPPSTLANWALLNAPTDKVLSVNGQTGTIVLGPTDVGAVASTAVGTGAGQIPTLDGSGLMPRAELGSGTANGTTYLRGDGTWATVSASGGSSLLGYVGYAPGTASVTTVTAGAAPVDIDATNLAVTFTAPTSGAVVVALSAPSRGSTTTAGYLHWSLRNGTTNVVGTEQIVKSGTSNGEYVRPRYRTRITGLTAGSSYTLKWAARALTANMSMIYGGSTNEFSTSVANYGPAVMEVWSA